VLALARSGTLLVPFGSGALLSCYEGRQEILKRLQ
jgi:hypothetical protein